MTDLNIRFKINKQMESEELGPTVIMGKKRRKYMKEEEKK